MDTQQQAMLVTFFIMIHGPMKRLTINTIPIAHVATAARARLDRKVASHAA